MNDPGSRLTTDVERAVQVLRDGGLVAIPTETVYGLAADARQPAAVARIFTCKQRPADHPLIVHIHRPEQIPDWTLQIPSAARQLAEAFWPGPLTLVLPRRPEVADGVTGGLPTVALRVPAHPLARQLLARFDGGLAAPSANRHGRVSPTTAQHVWSELGDAVDLLLDGGPCRVGIESTIVEFVDGGLRVLRPGAITADDLQRVTGITPSIRTGADVRAPGAMTSHYAPRAKVVLVDADCVLPELAGWSARGARVGVLCAHRPDDLAADVPWLSLGSATEQQARQLYARLRQADELGLDILVAVPPPDAGLGLALRDRLRRAAGLGDGRLFVADASRRPSRD
ncbi:L-threonylcarbamoyladenylate synthase [Rhodanobacter sp. T12-5]|uniref:L-threonylcarbamoyladenylate synthase n=1 Tax=Rhodanobacter sp. T12-5 TaxID=2024611 RepID=UPI0011EE455E|nr:L-threonylcarbamoyladenylate synthase [Rhodanobacter sp. T12-5]KAA0071255.1 threonylcarbamoyl-AMP synthase [Rhodanobacter sp. T12-5]